MSDRKVASGYTDIENNNSASNNSSNNNNNIINRNQAYNSISYGNTGSIHRNSMNSDMVSSAINEGVYVGGNMNSSAGQPNAMNNGHAINSTNNNNNSHTIEDSIEDVNFVISNLTVPSDMPTNVSKAYNNDTILGNEIQAYAKIAGKDWTYYVKDLNILIGRNTEAHDSKNSGPNSSSSNEIDIDLGPSKVVSRKHASINYSLNDRKWQLFMIGRNGLKVNGVRLNLAPNVPFDLTSGNIIDIGGTQMMFILPDAAPIIPQFFRDILFSNKRLKPDTALNSNRGHSSHSATNSYDHNLNPITAFQITEGLSHLHSSEGSIDQDYSTDNARDLKPPYSYATMITQAILSNPQGILSLSEIYDWISNHFAYYRHTKQGWQNSIRHNLSLNKAFEKVPRRPNEPGKGMKWQISESYRNEFLKKWQDGSLNKLKRGTSVSRQLQLHLMKNNALPSGRSISPSDDERASKPELNFYSTSDSHHHINGIKQETQFFDHSNELNQQMSHQQLPPQQIPQQIPQQTSHSHSMQNLLPPKSVNELKFNSRPELTSPIKSMNIPEINKQNDLMGRNFNSQQYTVPIIRTTSENSDVNNNNNDNNNNNNNGNSRDDHTGQSSGLNHNSNNNNGSNSNNAMNALNALTSPTKKLDPKMSLMTPERRLNLEHVQQFSPNHNLNSVNSSPALWSSTYLHLSTPIQNNANVLMNNDNNDQEKLPKLELESPLKNRNLGKLSDLKDVDLAKGFKS